jgi:hypothetical protein
MSHENELKKRHAPQGHNKGVFDVALAALASVMENKHE